MEIQMKLTFKSLICQVLVIATMMLPFQTGQAAMIGTDQANTVASAQADRIALTGLLSRAETVSQFQSMGLDAALASSRVAAMTDSEVQSLAGKINALPAGADGGGLALLILVVFFVWYFAFRR
jgi:hypothetical protein